MAELYEVNDVLVEDDKLGDGNSNSAWRITFTQKLASVECQILIISRSRWIFFPFMLQNVRFLVWSHLRDRFKST